MVLQYLLPRFAPTEIPALNEWVQAPRPRSSSERRRMNPTCVVFVVAAFFTRVMPCLASALACSGKPLGESPHVDQLRQSINPGSRTEHNPSIQHNSCQDAWQQMDWILEEGLTTLGCLLLLLLVLFCVLLLVHASSQRRRGWWCISSRAGCNGCSSGALLASLSACSWWWPCLLPELLPSRPASRPISVTRWVSGIVGCWVRSRGVTCRGVEFGGFVRFGSWVWV